MTIFNLSNATVGDARPTTLDYEVPPMQTEGATGQKETTYQNNMWSQYWGFFNHRADLKNAILLRATWDVGKGYTADPETTVILDHISGWGKDSFQDILFNLDVCMAIGGDSYAEIMWDDKKEVLLNLKVLDPSTMRHVVDDKGILLRYEQVSKLPTGTAVKKFEPKDILHFSLDRLADQIHGISLIRALADILKASGESFDDIQKVMHRQAKPLIIFKLKTDNATKIQEFKGKMQEAMRMATDNIMFIPDDENILSYEIVQIAVSPLLLEWKNMLRKDFYATIGSPELLSDSSGSTESGGKIGAFLFDQINEKRQSYIENQIWQQLQLRINLIPPASIAPDLQGDEAKDANGQLAFQPSDTTAGSGR